MDDKTKILLQRWNLEKLIDKFEEEEIDFDALVLLNRNKLQKMNLTIGTQSKLLSRLKELELQTEISDGMSGKNISMGDHKNSSSVNNSSNLSTTSTKKLPEASNSKGKETFSNCKIERTNCFHNSALLLDVNDLLSSDVLGQNLMKTYEIRTPKRLLDKERALLTRKIIQKALTMSIDLKPNDFIYLFNEIEKVFPSEIIDTYFIPCKGKMKHSLGRLPSYYRNLRPKITRNSLSLDDSYTMVNEKITLVHPTRCKEEIRTQIDLGSFKNSSENTIDVTTSSTTVSTTDDDHRGEKRPLNDESNNGSIAKKNKIRQLIRRRPSNFSSEYLKIYKKQIEISKKQFELSETRFDISQQREIERLELRRREVEALEVMSKAIQIESNAKAAYLKFLMENS